MTPAQLGQPVLMHYHSFGQELFPTIQHEALWSNLRPIPLPFGLPGRRDWAPPCYNLFSVLTFPRIYRGKSGRRVIFVPKVFGLAVIWASLLLMCIPQRKSDPGNQGKEQKKSRCSGDAQKVLWCCVRDTSDPPMATEAHSLCVVGPYHAVLLDFAWDRGTEIFWGKFLRKHFFFPARKEHLWDFYLLYVRCVKTAQSWCPPGTWKQPHVSPVRKRAALAQPWSVPCMDSILPVVLFSRFLTVLSYSISYYGTTKLCAEESTLYLICYAVQRSKRNS